MGTIKKVIIDEDLCIPQECCVDVCPKVFEIPSGASVARVKEGAHVHFATLDGPIREAVDDCPTGAISLQEE